MVLSGYFTPVLSRAVQENHGLGGSPKLFTVWYSNMHKINLKNVENTFINSQCMTEPLITESDHPKNRAVAVWSCRLYRNWHWCNMQQETDFSFGTKGMNTYCNSYCNFVKLNNFVAFCLILLEMYRNEVCCPLVRQMPQFCQCISMNIKHFTQLFQWVLLHARKKLLFL
jgi:hypothetical protein